MSISLAQFADGFARCMWMFGGALLGVVVREWWIKRRKKP